MDAVPAGFTTLPKSELRTEDNICNHCDARKLCIANLDDWCKRYPCMSYARTDGVGVIYKRLSV